MSTWTSVSFDLSRRQDVLAALRSVGAEAKFSVVLNVPAARFRSAVGLANLRFGSCARGDLVLDWPLRGQQGRDWLINQLSDLDTSSGGMLDRAGTTGAGAYTYDNHDGLDIDLPSFREMWNQSAVVYAAAPGLVVDVVDGNPDESTAVAPLGVGNSIQIRAENGYLVQYWHFARNSIRVGVGDYVVAGQALGVAGSSGNSSHPHLHFAVHGCPDSPGGPLAVGKAVETFAPAPGVTSNDRLLGPTMWRSPPTLTPKSSILGVYAWDRTRTSIRDELLPSFFVERTGDPMVGSGHAAQLVVSFGGNPGDVANCRWRDPEGREQHVSQMGVHESRFRHHRLVDGLPSLGQVGRWTIDCELSDASGIVHDTRTAELFVTPCLPGESECVILDISHDHYPHYFAGLTKAGYELAWFDGVGVLGDAFVNALFVPSRGYAWESYHNLTRAELAARHSQFLGRGFRMTHLESYDVGGRWRHAAVWAHDGGPATTYFAEVLSAQQPTEYARHLAEGWRPIRHATLYAGQQGFAHSMLFEPGNWEAHLFVGSEDAYQERFVSEHKLGFYPISLNATTVGHPHIFAIFAAGEPVAAAHNISFGELLVELHRHRNEGLHTELVFGYDTAGSGREFGGIWAR